MASSSLKPPHLQTSITVTNLTLSILSLLSLSLAAWFTIPSAPKFLSSLKPWLAPPYLFIAVHLIIALIWKLSDYQKHPDLFSKNPKPKAPHPTQNTHNSELSPTPSPDYWSELSDTSSNPPPNTSVSEDVNSPPPPVRQLDNSALTAAGSSVPEPAFELEKSITTNSDVVSAANSMPVFELENSLMAEFEEGEDWEEENESMEATWRAIMEKSSIPKQRKKGTELPPEVGDSHEEMKRKFEDFIKGKREQLRLERHESNQRRLLAGK